MPIDCPYCGEQKSLLGIRGHIITQDDDDHGRIGRLPDRFEETEVGRAAVHASTQSREAFRAADLDEKDSAIVKIRSIVMG